MLGIFLSRKRVAGEVHYYCFISKHSASRTRLWKAEISFNVLDYARGFFVLRAQQVMVYLGKRVVELYVV